MTVPATAVAEPTLLELFAEYTGAPVALLQKAVAHYGAFNLVTWNECPGRTWEEKAQRYYHEADEYLYDLVNSNVSKAHLHAIYRHYGHWPWFAGAGQDVLEFGGGLGVWCSILRELGRTVTYVDVDGAAARFARWYFARIGQADIEVLTTPSERLVLPAGRQWDFVYSDSVIEHLIDPAGTVERLAQAVRPGGLLYLIIDAHTVDARFPMHRHVHLADLLAGAPTLRRMAHVLHDGDGRNAFRA